MITPYERLDERMRKIITDLADYYFENETALERIRFIDGFARAALAGELKITTIASYEFELDDGRPVIAIFDPATGARL